MNGAERGLAGLAGGWRVSLRWAWRDARRERARAGLVVALIAIPVAGVVGGDGYARTMTASYQAAPFVQLGPADVRVTVIAGGPVEQSVNGQSIRPVSGASTRPAPVSPAAVLGLLPAGSQVVLDVEGTAQVGTATASAPADWREAPATDPLVAGGYRVRAGRLPAGPGQIALTPDLVRQIGAVLGGQVAASAPGGTAGAGPAAKSAQVVGIVDRVADPRQPGVLAWPGTLFPATGAAAAGDQVSWLASVPRPLRWSEVARANRAGAVVVAKNLWHRPPAGCADVSMLCRPAGSAFGAGPQPGRSTALLVLVAVAVAMAVLQVCLLAGPAFAVGLRRRQRQLGLLAAAGGQPADLRRAMLATGLVAGVAGALAGAAVGVGVLWAARGWLSGLTRITLVTPVFSARDVAATMAVAVASGLLAAVVPAETAARLDVAGVLAGRRDTAPLRRRSSLLGVALIAAGVAVVVFGVGGPVGLGMSVRGAALIALGLICAELGVVATVPLLLSRCAGLADRLPLTARFALREAVRHRMRTASAVSAVLAVVAGAVTLLVVVASHDATGARDYHPGMARGDALVHLAGSTATGSTGTPAAVRTAIQRVLPAAGVWPLRQVVTATGRAGGGAAVQVEPARSGPCVPPPSPTGPPALPAGCAFPSVSNALQPGQVLVADDPLVRILSGTGYADAKAALDAGRAVTFGRAYLNSAGRVSLFSPEPVGGPGGSVAGATGGGAPGSLGPPPTLASLPARYVAATPSSGAVLLPAGRLAGLHLTTRITGYYLHPVAAPTAAEQARLTAVVARAVGLTPAQTYVYVERGYQPTAPKVPLIGIAAAALVALLAALTTTALARSDAAADLGTMAAVGAGPGTARLTAAAQASVITVFGVALGVAAGLLPGWAATRATVQSPLMGPVAAYSYGSLSSGYLVAPVFAVPWAHIAVFAAALIAVTALAALLAGRGPTTLQRRRD